MSHGGAWTVSSTTRCTKKNVNIPLETIRGWVMSLVSQAKSTKLDGTGQDELDGKWFAPYMAEITARSGACRRRGQGR